MRSPLLFGFFTFSVDFRDRGIKRFVGSGTWFRPLRLQVFVMASRFKETLHKYADPASVQDAGWTQFMQDMVVAHDHDIHWAAQGKGKPQSGLPAKDLKPINFDNNTKTKLSFKEWSKDLNASLKKMDATYKEMLVIAGKYEGEWNEETYKKTVLSNISAVDALNYEEYDEDLTDYLRNVTEGDARDMVSAAASAGEAWFRMSERFYAKTVQGATAVANKISQTKRPTSINDANSKLTDLKGLLKEFARQSPDEPLPSSVIKSALIRVLPEAYHKTPTANVVIDKVDKSTIEDRIVNIIRDNTSGPVGMDLSDMVPEQAAPQHPQEQDPQQAAGGQWQPGTGEGWWTQQTQQQQQPQEEGAGQEWGANAFSKGKGKGKSVFNGKCYICNQFGHSARFCQSKGKGKGKDKGFGKGKGSYVKGKGGDSWYSKVGGKGNGGWGKGANSFEPNSWDNQDWNSWSDYPSLNCFEMGQSDNNSDKLEKNQDYEAEAAAILEDCTEGP